jgi:hypothetical protein
VVRPGWLLLLGCLSLGCSTLPDLGECGNGIVEAGEACDEDSELCATCQLVCVTSEVVAASGLDAEYVNLDPEVDTFEGDDRYCPTGHGCGADGVCRAPSGRFFRSGEPVDVESDRVEVGDVDDDDAADVIAIGDSTVRVLYGAEDEGAFVRQAVFPGPFVTGRPQATDVDGDGATDLLVPSQGGLVRFLARAGELTSSLGLTELEVPQLPNPEGMSMMVARSGGASVLLVVTETPAGVSAFARGQGLPTTCVVGGGATLQPGFALHPRAAGDWFAMAATTAGADAVCVFVPSQPGEWIPTRLDLAPGDRVDPTRGRPVFARVEPDGDDCPEIVVPVRRGASPAVVAFHGDSACNFTNTPAEDVVLEDPGALLAAGDVMPEQLGPTFDELVTANGIFKRKSAAVWQQVFVADSLGGAWATAEIGDYDADDLLDVGATQLTLAGTPDNNVALVLARASADGFAFNPIVVDTLGPVEAIVRGDYDADHASDLALVEGRESADGGKARAVSVVYGNAAGGLPGSPRVIETLDGGVRLMRVPPRVVGTLLEVDALDDLGVVRIPDESPVTLVQVAIAFGTASQSLVSPLWFDANGESLLGVVAGDFGVGDDGAADVAVVAPPANDVTTCPTIGLSVWFWSDGEPIATCDQESVLRGMSATLVLEAATNRAGEPVLVAALDGEQLVGDYWGADASCASASAIGTVGRVAFDVTAADVDGAPGDELLAAFGRREQDQSIYLVPAFDGCVVPAADAWTDLSVAAGHEACVAAVAVPPPLGAGDGAGRALVVACQDHALVTLVASGGTFAATELPLAVDGSPITAIGGDFTADGVDDVVVLSRVGGVATLELYAQCAASDVGGACDAVASAPR